MHAPDFTLTAGPTMASPRVLAALGSPLVFDYDPVFLERFRRAEDRLATVFRTSNDVVLMQGEAVRLAWPPAPRRARNCLLPGSSPAPPPDPDFVHPPPALAAACFIRSGL